MGFLTKILSSIHGATGVHPKVQATTAIATVLWAGNALLSASGHSPSPIAKVVMGPLLTFAAGWLAPSPNPLEAAVSR
jgi:hypothetical protein